MIDWTWWLSHIAFAIIGGCAGFLLASALAVSGSISRWEDAQPVPQDDSAEVAALKAELAEERAKVEFYYQMATERA